MVGSKWLLIYSILFYFINIQSNGIYINFSLEMKKKKNVQHFLFDSFTHNLFNYGTII